MDGVGDPECPVCGRTYPASVINKHVNDCLTIISDSPEIESCPRKKKRKSDQGASAWSFLSSSNAKAPLKNLKSADSSKFKLLPTVVTRTVESGKGQNKNADFQLVSCIDTADKDRTDDNISYEGTEKLGNAVSKTGASAPSSSKSESHAFFQTKSVSKTQTNSRKDLFAPLADRMRPTTMDRYVGQEKAVGRKSLLCSLLRSDNIPSLILWGPPGCGKTTLAKIIASNCKSHGNSKFVSLSATTAGVADVKQVINIARNDQKMFKRKTILFLDEIHRFNKLQQDVLLPHVEDGTIVLIGATTENPSFYVNGALLSRCRVIVLDKLTTEDILKILHRALKEIGARTYSTISDIDDLVDDDPCSDPNISPPVWVENQALQTLSHLCDGDGRVALNSLQTAVQSRVAYYQENTDTKAVSQQDEDETSDEVKQGVVLVNTEHIKDGLQRSHILYDRAGEEHYNCISALHKSVRGSDASAALYWMARMLEGGETPLFVARRLVVMASEDIGLADPLALNQAVAAYQACHFIGMPACEVILAQCAVYLARAPKSVEVYMAYEKAKNCVRNHEGPLPSVPLHLRNASTKLMKDLGYGKDYKYYPTEAADQKYFPECLEGTDFFS